MRKVCGPVEQPVTLISIRGLTKFYRMGDSVVHALDNVDLDIEKGERIIPEEALIHSQTFQEKLQELPQFSDTLLPRIMRTALHRLHSTRSIQDVSQAVRELAESEGDRLDSDLSLVRYIAWAIPSVGFIGTVRGIGEALAQADQAATRATANRAATHRGRELAATPTLFQPDGTKINAMIQDGLVDVASPLCPAENSERWRKDLGPRTKPGPRIRRRPLRIEDCLDHPAPPVVVRGFHARTLFGARSRAGSRTVRPG